MRVFEAAGSGLENYQLVHNAVGIAKFTYGTAGATAANNNFGFGSSAQTSASGLMDFTWATRFGTVPPNVHVDMGRLNTTAAYYAQVVAVGSNSCQMMFAHITHAEITATKAVGISRIEGAQEAIGTIFVMPYSATGTAFTTA